MFVMFVVQRLSCSIEGPVRVGCFSVIQTFEQQESHCRVGTRFAGYLHTFVSVWGSHQGFKHAGPELTALRPKRCRSKGWLNIPELLLGPEDSIGLKLCLMSM